MKRDKRTNNCPFCGGGWKWWINIERNADGDAYVACRGCGLKGPQRGTEEEAIKAWNGLRFHRGVKIDKNWITRAGVVALFAAGLVAGFYLARLS